MNEFFIITSIILLAAISPGPDFAMVVKNSLLGNRIAGIYTALGVTLSLLLHSLYGVLGLAIIISKSLLLFNIIKMMGACYLIYIGMKSLLEKKSSAQKEEISRPEVLRASQAFMQGLLCNLLNPKAVLFILAFFTLIIKPNTSLITQFGYGIEIALIHLIWFSCLAIMITHPQVKRKLDQIQYYIVKMMGALLVGFGIRIGTLSSIIN